VSNFLRPMRTFFSQLGASLPGANPSKHGQVNIKQAAATEDEAYLVLRDSSGVLQYRRLVTTTLADSTYALEVKEGNSSVDTGVTVLDFDASDFTVSESPEGEINLGLAYGTSAGTPAEGNHAHDADYVELTGDTMTGALMIDSDSSPPASIVSDGAIRLLITDANGTTVRYRFSGSAFQIWNSNGIATFSDAGSTTTFQVDGSTGDTTIAGILTVDVDDDGAFAISTAAGSPRLVVDTVNFSAAGAINLANGMRMRGYSDSFSTLQFEIDGSNGNLTLGSGVRILTGTGDPEGVHTAPVGSLFLRTDGGSGTTLYVKESGTGNTGWSTTA
jgi:hypothetical protein